MKDLKLWGIFISLIIVVQALGFFVFSGIAWCLFHAGILSPDHPPMGWFPFLTNTCSSALISPHSPFKIISIAFSCEKDFL